jgi:hypothetical protein
MKKDLGELVDIYYAAKIATKKFENSSNVVYFT